MLEMIFEKVATDAGGYRIYVSRGILPQSGPAAFATSELNRHSAADKAEIELARLESFDDSS